MGTVIGSPYDGLAPADWRAKTQELVDAYPLKPQDLVNAALEAWESLFRSSIGGFYIGVDIYPKPQTMGFFLHELIPLELSRRFPGIWREGQNASEKDLVYIPDVRYSAEIKTSSHPSHIFGNRSYAQVGLASKKDKSGYYIAINFQPFQTRGARPQIVRIRFGWLDHRDWIGQKAATGQQSRLLAEVENGKLLQLYTR